MKRFGIGGLPQIEALVLFVGQGNGDPQLGGQAGADCLPAVRYASVPEPALNRGQEMLGQDRNKQVPLQAAVQAVIHRSEARFALEGPEGWKLQ